MRHSYWLAIATCCVFSMAANGADELPPVFAAKGLLAVGNQLVVAEEAILANVMKNVKANQVRYLAAYRTAYQAEEKVLSLFEEYVASEKMLQQMMQQFRVTQTTSNEERQLGERIREISAYLTSERQETDAPFVKLVEARTLYIQAIREANDLAEAGAKRYGELAVDLAAKAALEELNKSATKPLAFGPSRTFSSNSENATKYREFIRSGEIPIRTQDGSAHIDVSIDAQKPVAFRLEPVSTTSYIRAETWSQEIKVKTDEGNFPRAKFPSKSNANDSIPAGYTPIQSAKVGDFEVQNAVFVLFWPHKDITDNRLGMPFFRNFEWKIDSESQTLTLTEINDPGAKKPSDKAKKKKK